MLAFIARRAAFGVFVVTVAVTAVFLVLLGIGDPCTASLGSNAKAEQIKACKSEHGFDRPVLQQYAAYLGVAACVREGDPEWSDDAAKRGHCGILQGNLGLSMTHREPVGAVMLERLPRTLLLESMTILFELVLGLTIGIIAATRRNSWFDTGFMATAFLGISAPSFVTGLLFLNWFAFRAGWFPVGGYGEGFWDHVYHAILPAFTLAIIGAATYARVMRSEMIEQLQSDYVRTARAKGLPEWRVVLGHAVRNALLPIVTMMGLTLSVLVSGSIITESIYAWPGMGRLVVESIVNNDIWAVLGVVLFASAMVQAGNLVADIAVALLDPRIRLQKD
jgi:peptide/nickel transport system permease protein